MLKLLLVSPKNNTLHELASVLSTHNEVDLSCAESGEIALDLVSRTPYDLVIVDEKVHDMTGLELAERIVRTNAIINCAAVSALSPEDFHEASEGLGLIAQLPTQPQRWDAEDLLERLKTIMGLANSSD